jgi:hypothetical protein
MKINRRVGLARCRARLNLGLPCRQAAEKRPMRWSSASLPMCWRPSRRMPRCARAIPKINALVNEKVMPYVDFAA